MIIEYLTIWIRIGVVEHEEGLLTVEVLEVLGILENFVLDY